MPKSPERSPPTPRCYPKATVIDPLNYYEYEVEYEMPPEAFTIEDVHRFMGIVHKEFLDENGVS